MSRFLENSGLTYYSNKLKTYLSNKFSKIETDISNLDTKVESDISELETKIQTNTDGITKNTADIVTINDNVSAIDTKVDANYTELKNEFDSADMRPTGDSIYLNNVEQFVFKDVAAGQVLTIPNSGDGSDFLIECFVQTEQGTPLEHNVLNINTSTKDLLEYDDRYVTITDDGASPKNTVSMQLTKQYEVDGYNVFITDDFIPVELLDSINSLTDYTVTLDDTVQ
jgi:hypothetical protein